MLEWSKVNFAITKMAALRRSSNTGSRPQSEKFANDVKNSAKPDCLKNDHGLGLFNVVPLIYDIVKDKCI